MVFLSAFLFIIVGIYPLLYPFYKVLDDPTYLYMVSLMDDALREEGPKGFFNVFLYIDAQDRSRLLLLYLFVRYMLWKIVGASPFVHHLVQTVSLTASALLILLVVQCLSYQPWVAILACGLFFLFGGEVWTSSFNNWNDISTFEWLQVVMWVINLWAFLNLWLRKERRCLLLLYLSAFLFYFSKETGIVLAGSVLCFALFHYLAVRKKDRAILHFTLAHLLGALALLTAYLSLRGLGFTGAEYVGQFSFSATTLLRSVQKISSFLDENYGVLHLFLPALFLLRLSRSFIAGDKLNQREEFKVFLLLSVIGFWVVLLPFERILVARMILPLLLPLSLLMASELGDLWAQIENNQRRRNRGVLLELLVLMPLALIALLIMASWGGWFHRPALKFANEFALLLLLALIAYIFLTVYIRQEKTFITWAFLRGILIYLFLYFVIGFTSLYNYFTHLRLDFYHEYSVLSRTAKELPERALLVLNVPKTHYFSFGSERLFRLVFNRPEVKIIDEESFAQLKPETPAEAYFLYVGRMKKLLPLEIKHYEKDFSASLQELWRIRKEGVALVNLTFPKIWKVILNAGRDKQYLPRRVKLRTFSVLYKIALPHK